MIYLIGLIIHIVTLFNSGHMENPSGEKPGVCCICGRKMDGN
jgi:hypothetical protein